MIKNIQKNYSKEIISNDKIKKSKIKNNENYRRTERSIKDFEKFR